VAGPALGAGDVDAATAPAVASAVLTAGRRRRGGAGERIVGLAPGRDEGTVAERARQIACHAGGSARGAAADTVHTVAGLAFVVATARCGLALRARGAAGHAHSRGHGRVAGDVLGPADLRGVSRIAHVFELGLRARAAHRAKEDAAKQPWLGDSSGLRHRLRLDAGAPR